MFNFKSNHYKVQVQVQVEPGAGEVAGLNKSRGSILIQSSSRTNKLIRKPIIRPPLVYFSKMQNAKCRVQNAEDTISRF